MRIWIALLSLLTVFGGHFSNRRLDRVVLVGTLLLCAAMANIAVGLIGVLFRDGVWLSVLIATPLFIVLTAVASALLAFRDARGRAERAPLGRTMSVSGVLLSICGLATLYLSASSLMLGRFYPGGASEYVTMAGESANPEYFGTSIHFGGSVEDWDAPPPPRGDAHLRGRIMVDGRGAEALHMDVFINGRYKAEVTTDEHGVFDIQLPAGTWYVNHVATTSWDQKPERRELELFSSGDSPKGDGMYQRRSFFDPRGLEVRTVESSGSPALTLELRDLLTVEWPAPHSQPIPDGTSVTGPATLETSAITWRPHEAAAEYEVQLSHVIREGSTTRFTPMLRRRLSTTRLPLASLPQRAASEGDESDEYTVRIYAFDSQGRLLTHSGSDPDELTFNLGGELRLADEPQTRSVAREFSDEHVLNSMRLALVSKLLDQKQYEEARQTLDRVTADAPAGQVLALRGRLAALQGNCREALELFAKAEEEGGPGCVAPSDRQLCPPAAR